ncbi:hypothetical protein F3I16_15930 [Pseudomonas sp. L-22-4S-12]|uniref:hypothetical protein n=1 Tax=Pseudomonas sp. L-22-4S-12 TaxID=2610893 RepID=UPI00132C5A00|nr:hypothetical protein [Pseudomonas sp. L-22-4S-12]MWV17531.1 hypothetical protein [Pseudomonas sp. L-22-4S-12]
MAKAKAEQNLALWDQVKTTDKDFTRTAHFDGRDVTSINGMYMIQRATEMFGPLGKGWGFDVLVDRFDQGAPILDKSGQVVIGHEQMHTMQIKLWYLHGGARRSITQFGHTPYVQKTKWGISTDFDAVKKSLTDAIKKCLSLLGFSADVYLGMFEDAIYLEGLALKKRLDEAGDTDTVMDEAKGEFKDWLNRQISALDRCPTPQALELMRKKIVETARAKAMVVKINPDNIEARINEASAARLTALTNPEE